MVSAAYFPDGQRALRELVAVLELAAIALALVSSDLYVAIRPAQFRRRSEGKDDIRAAEFGFEARAYGGSRQAEVQGPAENHGIGFANDVVDLLAENFGLKKKCCGVGPIEDGDGNVAPAAREIVGLNSREVDRSGDARNARGVEDIPLSGIERRGADRTPPAIVRRAGRPVIAGDIAGIDDLECGDARTHVDGCGRFDRIADEDVRHHGLRPARYVVGIRT